MIAPTWQAGDVQLFLGDCLEILPQLEAGSVDAVITDPPYGIGAEKGTNGFGESKHTVNHYNDNWTKPPKAVFDNMLRISNKVFIFGGNYFTDLLPQSDCWLVWDKVGEIKFENPFSDCELVWTSLSKKTVKKYLYILQGFIGKEKDRYHPTQKPIALMKMLINQFSNEGDTILDPFAGSGTTLVACVQTGRKGIGIEIEEKYFDIAVKRIQQAQLQIRMDI